MMICGVSWWFPWPGLPGAVWCFVRQRLSYIILFPCLQLFSLQCVHLAAMAWAVWRSARVRQATVTTSQEIAPAPLDILEPTAVIVSPALLYYAMYSAMFWPIGDFSRPEVLITTQVLCFLSRLYWCPWLLWLGPKSLLPGHPGAHLCIMPPGIRWRTRRWKHPMHMYGSCLHIVNY